MSKWLQLLQQHRAIAVIRCSDFELAYKMAQSVAMGGMKLIEITWNSDRPGELVARLRKELPHCTIGTGTILNLHQLQEAVTAGSQFAVAPYYDPQLLEASVSLHNSLCTRSINPFRNSSSLAARGRGS